MAKRKKEIEEDVVIETAEAEIPVYEGNCTPIIDTELVTKMATLGEVATFVKSEPKIYELEDGIIRTDW